MDILLIDWISLAVVIFFGVLGLMHGLAKEIFSAAAWVISIIGAWYFGPLLFPYIDSYIINSEIKSAVSFVLIFLTFFTLINLTGSAISKFLNSIGLNFLNKTLGIFFGVLKGSVLLASIYILASGILEDHIWWTESYSRELTIKIAEFIEPLLRDWTSQAEILVNKENVTFLP